MNISQSSTPNRVYLRASALLLFIVCLPGLSHAQWSTSGSNVTTSSNVGIGPTTPDNPLTISSTSANLQNFYRSGVKIGTISASSNNFNFVAETGDFPFFVTGGHL